MVYAHDGAAKNLLRGANVMLVGINLEDIEEEIPEGSPVAVYIEGKQHAISVGITTCALSKSVPRQKGIAITSLHHLGDDLWLKGNSEL